MSARLDDSAFADPGAAPPDPPTTEAAAAGGARDIASGWVGYLNRPNLDPIQATRGGLQIYEELLRDHAVWTAFQQRQLALVSKPLEVVAGGDDRQSKKAAADLQAQLSGLSWDSVTSAMLYGRINGYAVAECMFELDADGRRVVLSDVRVRKARRFVFGPKGELLLRTYAMTWGEPLPPRKFWVYSSHGDTTDDPYGYGLGQILYWLVWFKRNDLQLWLKALDRYASPTPVGEFPPGTPPEERDKLLDTLVGIRNGSVAAFPTTSVVRMLEAAKSGAGDYEVAHKMLDDAITKVIIGPTMTSSSGSSHAQSKTHENVLGWIVQADDDLISDSFNVGPARWLTEWNFPGATPPRIRRRTEPPADLEAQATIDQILINSGWEPSLEYIQDTYGRGWTKAPAGGLQLHPTPVTPDAGAPEF